MKLTRIGTIQDTESGIDYYRIDDLFDTDDFVIPAFLDISLNQQAAEIAALPSGALTSWPPSLSDLPEATLHAARCEIEDWLATQGVHTRGCGCSHDCCGHRFYDTPDLLPDPIRQHFIVAHSWGINV